MSKNAVSAAIDDWLAFRKKHGISLWSFLARYKPWVFSHHPENAVFRDHVWFFNGLYFCKGCVITLAGMVIGLVFEISTHWLHQVSVVGIAFIFCLLLLPTFCSAFRPKCPREIKHIARFLLGVVTCSAIWFLFITDSWLLRLVVVVVYLAVKLPLERKRVRDNEFFLTKNDSTVVKKRKILHAGCDRPKKQ